MVWLNEARVTHSMVKTSKVAMTTVLTTERAAHGKLSWLSTEAEWRKRPLRGAACR
jgi:hypothetical protein